MGILANKQKGSRIALISQITILFKLYSAFERFPMARYFTERKNPFQNEGRENVLGQTGDFRIILGRWERINKKGEGIISFTLL
jgi:hypothetical protein